MENGTDSRSKRKRVKEVSNPNGELSFEQYLKSNVQEVEQALPGYVPANWDIPSSLRESFLYSLMAGGKRLRPILVLAAAESVGGQAETALPAACAIEMIHTYSLVHDDLPAMDNDDFRRGKPTNHKLYGEAMAILAGDALLTHAFYTVVQASRKHGASAEAVLTVVEELAQYAGLSGMVGGQAADMLGEQGQTTLEQLQYIHEHKTGDLIVASLRAGGHIAGANAEQIEALTTFGRKIGMAFQIQDDVLDVEGEQAMIGKPVGSDEKSGKVTFPYFMGMDASKREIEQLTCEAKEALTAGSIPYPERLLQLADYLMKRNH
ncbi:polyprenyl synthetase family protein [Paenibacillus agilis]|uniref:Farnesyl diphosphate synthase n=1 Tax=Paenibacillus agilis TaxID=3020863 RepID=A0A559IYW1_9BACL|nr:polyprenyl synthetase family protein [Paenibacillus agilis]